MFFTFTWTLTLMVCWSVPGTWCPHSLSLQTLKGLMEVWTDCDFKHLLFFLICLFLHNICFCVGSQIKGKFFFVEFDVEISSVQLLRKPGFKESLVLRRVRSSLAFLPLRRRLKTNLLESKSFQ